MSNTITQANSTDLVPALTYAQHHVDNLRTKSSHMVAMVSGETAEACFRYSNDPRRLFFVLVPQPCEWFALCDREATTAVAHPVLGDVPCCARCAAFATA